MAWGHSSIGLHLTVARISKNVGRAYRASPPKCGLKDLRVPRHGKLGESFSRHTGKCVEGISFAILSCDVVKECTELTSAQFNSGISHDLDQPLRIKLGANRNAGPVQHF